jgi:hypothetical protein
MTLLHGSWLRDMKKSAVTISVMLIVLIGLAAKLPAAERTITTYTNAGAISGADSSGPSPITFQDNMADFPQPVVGQNINKAGAISVDVTNKALGLGGGVYDGYGSIWYQGNSDIAYCVNGVCDFGGGFMAYYDFQFTTADSSAGSTSSADGFNFAVISAINNDVTRTGGSPPGTSLGELMGYAGPGTTADGQGLRPPKMAVEFDTYPNTGGDHSTDMCSAGTRMDPTISGGFKNHIALLFWGMNSIAGQCGPFSGVMYNRDTFDDNQHGAGDAGEVPPTPQNSPNIISASDTDYYEGSKNGIYNWMEDGQLHRFRVEMTRSIMPNAATGKFDYTVKAWVDCGGSCTLANFQNVLTGYSDTNPQISKTVSLDPTYHDQFRRILIGFTEATGGATQIVTISNFKLYFPQSSCTYAIAPASASYPSTGGLGTVAITAGAGCAWNSVSNSTWLHVTPSGTGTGSGAVSYAVDANLGPARTGTMSIAGQTFTVTQAVNCIYAISPTNASYAAAGGAGTVAVTVGTGCAWTAVSNDGWITVTAGQTGSGNGTVSYSVAANTGPARTGTITIAEQTFTVTQANGCTYAISPASASYVAAGGSGTVGVTAGAGCTWTAVSNVGWISVTSGAAGTGSGTVGYTLATNTGGPRNGTITIGGQTFTVTQLHGCITSISPSSASYGNSGGSGTVGVTAGAGCTWTAASNNAWITITSGASGTSNGTVGYTVGANTAPARTGTITITGLDGALTFSATQSAGAPTCTLTPSPSVVAYNSSTSLGWTIANGPANGTWSVSPGGTCANFFGSSGGSCATANQTTAGARTYTLTVSNTNGSGSCSATFYVGCSAYRVWNNTGSTWDFLVTGQSCRTSRTTGSEITTSTAATQLQPGETVSRYTTAGAGCSSAVQGNITYTGAMNVDVVINGGNGDCRVNYNAGDVPGDR